MAYITTESSIAVSSFGQIIYHSYNMAGTYTLTLAGPELDSTVQEAAIIVTFYSLDFIQTKA